jgi:hypothetical protein
MDSGHLDARSLVNRPLKLDCFLYAREEGPVAAPVPALSREYVGLYAVNVVRWVLVGTVAVAVVAVAWTVVGFDNELVGWC